MPQSTTTQALNPAQALLAGAILEEYRDLLELETVETYEAAKKRDRPTACNASCTSGCKPPKPKPKPKPKKALSWIELQS